MDTHPERLIAREADAAALSPAERRELDAHLEACAACRDALESQRMVARVLHARVGVLASPGFVGRVSARIDADRSGILGLANWRAWTVGLAPVAAALVLIAYLGVGLATTDTAGSTTETTATFETWASASAGSTPAAVFLQRSASGEQLLETVLTGALPASSGGSSNVR